MGNMLPCAGGCLMALEPRDDQSSGMFSSSAGNAIGSDGSGPDQKARFSLLFAHQTEQKPDMKSQPASSPRTRRPPLRKPFIGGFQH